MAIQQEKNTFRLIAVQTGDQLTEKEESFIDTTTFKVKQNYNYLKLLKPNTAFTFFNCYEIKEKGKVLEYSLENDIPKLYKLKKNKKVNVEVSAIVGKNGSGKSTLLEIIYLAIHNLSVAIGILKDEDRNEVVLYENYLRCDLIFQVEKHKYIRLHFHFDDDTNQVYAFESSTEDQKTFIFDKDVTLDRFKLENFFYNVVVNYSIYGLNDYRIGKWVNCLFHKNDSYQTPIVINPMRTHGNFDINKEENLTRSRLIANTIIKYNKSTKENWVSDYQYLHEIIFKLNQYKIEVLEKSDDFNGIRGEIKSRTIQKMIEDSELKSASEIVKKAIYIYSGMDLDYKNVKYASEVELYIVKKLYKIAFTYEKFHKYLEYRPHDKPVKFDSKIDWLKLDDYFKLLKKDTSHVTTKLRQALNYLINDPLFNNDSHSWFKTNITGETFKIPFNTLAKRLMGKEDKIINCIPPSLFKTHINIKNRNTGAINDLEKLSSGELQLINSVQSSLYHLNNLDSYYKDKDNKSKIKYRNVLLTFDEVELYFHPEFQRRMIAFLLKEVDELNLELVRNIHILFVTHSPFILSDIPRVKILKLIEGKPFNDDHPTFAANIYELLRDTFYLESNTGGYSIEVINLLLNELNEILDLKNKKGVGEFKESKITDLKDSNALKIISTIGDSVVRRKMKSMYYECMGSEKVARQNMLVDEIRMLNRDLKNIE